MNLRTRDFSGECIIFYDHELIISNTTSITQCLYIHLKGGVHKRRHLS
jgi:hypothetical protein